MGGKLVGHNGMHHSESSLQRTIVYRTLIRYGARFAIVGVCISACTELIRIHIGLVSYSYLPR